ncbi:MAG: hypothetical protein FD137_1014 [Spirochaetes bacterium]|nr:MAG: hypothetical protein FD137_1014 [Spirochaetota bacterium]
MTKQEYIDLLSRQLYGFDDESKRDILMEIEDHIDELLRSHPEVTEANIIADLEKPDTLAQSLRREAGIDTPRPEEQDLGAEPDRPENKKRKTRITVDGEDLEDVIKRAVNLARLFKGTKLFREENHKGESEGSRGEKRIRLEDIPLDGVRTLEVKSLGSDIKILLSLGGLSIAAEGAQDSAFSVDDDEEGTVRIRTGARHREPDAIEVRVPSSLETLVVSSGSGNIIVADRVGDLELRTASGDMEVWSCSGNVKAESASGNISLAHCSEAVHARSASGDIAVSVDDLCSGVVARSASGNIVIEYSEDFSARFRWTTVSGSIACDAPSQGPRSARTHDGLIPVEISTVSGDIEVKGN